MDIVERPEWASALFAAIAEAIIRLAHRIHSRQRDSGFEIDYMCVSNCTVNMVSPRVYERMLAPHDRRLAEAFRGFGVHTCNWNVTPYLDVLSRLPKVGYLDMGLET